MILGVIPARYASSRFPGKPLAMIHAKSMIERVYTQCKKAEILDKVVVATDDERIYAHVQGFGGEVVMTSSEHNSGTERIAEVAHLLPNFSQYLNIQGDEPFIEPQQIAQLCEILLRPDAQIATLLKRIHDIEILKNPNIVKAVIDNQGNALYFSRSPIPFVRNAPFEEWLSHASFYQHIGIYGFQKSVLLEIPNLPIAPLEKIEYLEQLAWLSNAYKIKTTLTEFESIAIDTPEDLQKAIDLQK
jgi:3-deoxy-manno-octulosonate cytidylyltransferase (CMP-KDO synthetase)